MEQSNKFTEREIEVIFNGDAEMPFRVLQITDKIDSFILRMKSENVSTDNIVENDTLQHLIERMRVTMEDAGGVGIAAAQVGVLKNVFLFMRVDNPERPIFAAINPQITATADELVCFEHDGCLSIPNISENTLRYPWIEVSYWDENGNFIEERLEGYSRTGNFVGVIFQHEYDHLQGTLFIDKICEEIEE